MNGKSQRPTRIRHAVMGFLCVLAFLSYFDRNCISRAQEGIQTSLGIDRDGLGWIFGAFWFAYSMLEIPGGWLGDRYGARRTLTRIVLGWSLFTALSGSATGFWSLLVFRLLFGAAEAGAFPNMALVQSRWLPLASRGRSSGLLWLLARWGAAFAPLIFGAMMAAFDSPGFRHALASVPGLGAAAALPAWRLGFWAAGLAGVVWCVGFFIWFRDRPQEKRSVNAAELALIDSGRPEAAERPRMDRQAWRALFTSRSLWAMALLYISNSFGWSFYVSWLPAYLKAVHRIEFDQSQVMSGLPLFSGGLSCLAGGWLSDRLVKWTGRKWLGRAALPILGYGIAAAAMYALPWVSSSRQAVLLMCIASMGGDLGQGANWATIVDLGGSFAGASTGFINMIGNAGNYLQPRIGAWIFKSWGWNALFPVYACMYVFAASMWLFIDPARPFHQSPEAPLAAPRGSAGGQPPSGAASRS
jgi:ACS family glucarate transporter-like MFS transporter